MRSRTCVRRLIALSGELSGFIAEGAWGKPASIAICAKDNLSTVVP